jgi:hypothetical protein
MVVVSYELQFARMLKTSTDQTSRLYLVMQWLRLGRRNAARKWRADWLHDPARFTALVHQYTDCTLRVFRMRGAASREA